jgi:hypothetical protein
MDCFVAIAPRNDGLVAVRTSHRALARIRLISVELEIGGEATAECAKTLQQLIAPGFACDTEIRAAGDMDFNLIALLEAKRCDDNSR